MRSLALDNDYVQRPDLRIICVLVGLADHYYKDWCKPKYLTIQRLLRERHGTNLSTRTLARHLGALIRDGWLTKQVRHCRARDGSLELHSTLYRLQRKARSITTGVMNSWQRFNAPHPRAARITALPKVAATVVPPYHIVELQHGRTAPPPAWDEIVKRLAPRRR